MKRIVSIIVAVAVLFVAVPAFADPAKGDKAKTPAPATQRVNIFTKAAIEKAVAPAVVRASPSPASAPRRSGSFWKTPWPYVIIAGSVAAFLIIRNGDSGGVGGGIY